MKWYLAKIVYRIVCGDGNHTAQFDEQLRLISAKDEDEAFEKATSIGHSEGETFFNNKAEAVQWVFVNVSELYRLQQLIDGAELYSRITEVDDADSYIDFVHHKAAGIRQKSTHQILNLI
ncbi:MAG TPA: DUF4288 domain-containing protein [Chitinophagaceae bacterium]|nr:DUF4288 domain-containing protein [Chitinophagaceae bacterium]